MKQSFAVGCDFLFVSHSYEYSSCANHFIILCVYTSPSPHASFILSSSVPSYLNMCAEISLILSSDYKSLLWMRVNWWNFKNLLWMRINWWNLNVNELVKFECKVNFCGECERLCEDNIITVLSHVKQNLSLIQNKNEKLNSRFYLSSCSVVWTLCLPVYYYK